MPPARGEPATQVKTYPAGQLRAFEHREGIGPDWSLVATERATLVVEALSCAEMIRSRILHSALGWVGATLLFATLANSQPPIADDAVWADYLAYLRAAPPADGPLELIQGFHKSLIVKGTPPADAERRLAVMLRLMRERTEAWPLMFDRIYASAAPNFSTKPNAFLMAAVAGRTPGRALDIGMGQGRNAVGLALQGWAVTGFDVSAEGLAVAKAEAARAGVEVKTVLETDQRFDYGIDQWDLIAVIYGPGSIADPAFVARLQRSLKPGGLVVVESFASEKSAVQRRPVDIDPADLLQAFSAFRLLRFEDTMGVSDWDPQTTGLARMIAQKRP